MHSSLIKQEFLKKWTMSLELIYGTTSTTKNMMMMSFLERKKVIKLSADVAMASVKHGRTTSWSRAVISNASKDDENKIIIKKILGVDEFERRVLLGRNSLILKSFGCNNRRVRSNKILRRSCTLIRRNISKAAQLPPPRRILTSSSNIIAQTMVKKRTQLLKSLLPGGESMDDEVSLLEETLDYIISLKAQVEVMRGVVDHHASKFL